jgi:hypothetical protein
MYRNMVFARCTLASVIRDVMASSYGTAIGIEYWIEHQRLDKRRYTNYQGIGNR